MTAPKVTTFFDEETFSASHVVADPETGACAIIDPVLDFDPASGRTNTKSAALIVEHVRGNNFRCEWILETHVHADHLTAAPFLKDMLGGRTGIGSGIVAVQKTFGEIFNAGAEFGRDGGQFDILFGDGETFMIGAIEARAIHTPGHTPACATYLVGEAAFVGDTLFMPDYGTARADFPGGDARLLYRSIQKIFALPEATRLFMCHDYKAPARQEFAWETTVKEQRERNIHIGPGVSEDQFAAMRHERDQGLPMPRLLFPSVQINMRAGAAPPPEDNGVSYLKSPLNLV